MSVTAPPTDTIALPDPGAPDATDDDPVDVAIDDDGRLAEDMACRQCGYNLRGLALEAVCPECRTSVGRSVHGDLLRFCEPSWVECLAAGMRLYVIAIVLGILLGIGAAVALGISLGLTGTLALPVVIVLALLGAALTALQLWAYWKITTPDPGRDESQQPITIRRVARVCLIAASLIGVAEMLFDTNQFGPLAVLGGTSMGMQLIAWFIGLAQAGVGLVGTAALFLYAMSLAARIPDDVLRARTRLVMWGFLVSMMLLVGIILTSELLLPASANPKQLEIILGLATLGVALPGMVFWIWGIVLLFQYRNRLMAAAERARQTWARMG